MGRWKRGSFHRLDPSSLEIAKCREARSALQKVSLFRSRGLESAIFLNGDRAASIPRGLLTPLSLSSLYPSFIASSSVRRLCSPTTCAIRCNVVKCHLSGVFDSRHRRNPLQHIRIPQTRQRPLSRQSQYLAASETGLSLMRPSSN